MLKQGISVGIAILIVIMFNFSFFSNLLTPSPTIIDLCDFRENRAFLNFGKALEAHEGVDNYLGDIKIKLEKERVATNEEATFRLSIESFRIEDNEIKDLLNPYYYVLVFGPDQLEKVFPCFCNKELYDSSDILPGHEFRCYADSCDLSNTKFVPWTDNQNYNTNKDCQKISPDSFCFEGLGCTGRDTLMGVSGLQNYAYRFVPDRAGEWKIYVLLFDAEEASNSYKQTRGGEQAIAIGINSFMVGDQPLEEMDFITLTILICSIVLAVFEYYLMVSREFYEKIEKHIRPYKKEIAILLLLLFIVVILVNLLCPHACMGLI